MMHNNEDIKVTIPNRTILRKIIIVRGIKVMIDRDLADLYGVETKYLKRQVRRNIKRFPVGLYVPINRPRVQGLEEPICHLQLPEYDGTASLD